MIKTFADREPQQLYVTGKSRRLPPEGRYAISINDQWRICFRFVAGCLRC
jgi:plasmid maintenance system killer protein